MPRRKKIDPRPFGVPLDQLESMLAQCNQDVHRRGNALISRCDTLETEINVRQPESLEVQESDIQAIITVTTPLPEEIGRMIKGEVDALNKFATLGSLYEDKGHLYVGSRLTVFKNEEAWDLQLALLYGAVVLAANSIIIGLFKAITHGSQVSIEGEPWTEAEFKHAQEMLSGICFCNADGLGLAAEFGLEDGAISSVMGHRTALYKTMADQPHPFLGDGLFCLLEMPYSFADRSVLDALIAKLNRIEMCEEEMPPHFGAWCKSRSGHEPAYVSFLPNAFHCSGIHVNMAIWAMHRAKRIDAVLKEARDRISGMCN